MIYNGKPLILLVICSIINTKEVKLCQRIICLSILNNLQQILNYFAKTSRHRQIHCFKFEKVQSVYANIREANYGQSRADMLSKFEIALKECSETEGWLQLLYNTNAIDEDTYKKYRNLCGRIRRILISSCKTLKEKYNG